VLEEEAALLEEAEKSQVMGSKHKEIATRDKEGQRLSKKAKERQQGKESTMGAPQSRWGVLTPVRGV